jgi:hypothetical protein
MYKPFRLITTSENPVGTELLLVRGFFFLRIRSEFPDERELVPTNAFSMSERLIYWQIC